MKLTLEHSERLYNVLLSLYPVHFRVRFAPEMVQLFRDCCHQALEKGEVAVIVAFWVRMTRDLLCSVLQERRREFMGPIHAGHPLIGMIDMLLIPTMVTGNLLVLGPVLTLMVGGDAIPNNQFMMTSGFFSVAIGSLAVVTSLIMTKLRPTVRLWVKLST